MKKALKIAMITFLAVAILIPALTIQASAATYRWNGTSLLKSGRNYAVTTQVTMDSSFIIPANTTLTVYSTGKLTIAKGATATLKGTLAVNKGGTLNILGTLNADENSTIKVSGKLGYSASAKLKINGKLTVNSTGTIAGSGATEVNLSTKSQYNTDIEKINTYLDAKNYSKACSLLENAIKNYPNKSTTLCPAYSSAVINWADTLADSKNYVKACSILNAARKHLSDTTDVDNRYDFYQGYIPMELIALTNYGSDIKTVDTTDTFGNTYRNCYNGKGEYELKYFLDGKYTNLAATIAMRNIGKNGNNDIYVEVLADGVSVYTSKSLTETTKPFDINIDITGADELAIKFSNWYWDSNGIILADATVYKE